MDEPHREAPSAKGGAVPTTTAARAAPSCEPFGEAAFDRAFFKPFYDENTNAATVVMHLSTAWMGLWGTLAMASNQKRFVTNNMGSVIALGGFPMVCVLGVVLSDYRISELYRRALWVTAQTAHGRMTTTSRRERTRIAAMDPTIDVNDLPYANGLIHDRSPGLILICSNYTSSRACAAHLGRAIETLEAYSLPGRLWFCEHDANSLDDCSVQFERSWQPSSSGVLDDRLVDQQAALGVN